MLISVRLKRLNEERGMEKEMGQCRLLLSTCLLNICAYLLCKQIKFTFLKTTHLSQQNHSFCVHSLGEVVPLSIWLLKIETWKSSTLLCHFPHHICLCVCVCFGCTIQHMGSQFPPPGIEPMPPALEAWSLNPLTAWKFQKVHIRGSEKSCHCNTYSNSLLASPIIPTHIPRKQGAFHTC